MKKRLTGHYTCGKLFIPLDGVYFFVSIFLRIQLKIRVPKEGGKTGKNPLNGGAVMRVKVTLACTECKQRNYNTMKNKKNTPDRMEMNKYCRFCRKHTLHKETK